MKITFKNVVLGLGEIINLTGMTEFNDLVEDIIIESGEMSPDDHLSNISYEILSGSKDGVVLTVHAEVDKS